MNGCAPSVLFLLHYDERRAVATPHCSAHRVQRRGRIGTDFQSMRSVTTAMALRQSPLVEIAQPPTKRASPAIKRRLTAMTPVASRLRHRHSLRYRGASGTNTGFDGVPYQPVWPDGNTTLHPTSILFTSPLMGQGYSVRYSRVAFEAGLPRIRDHWR